LLYLAVKQYYSPNQLKQLTQLAAHTSTHIVPHMQTPIVCVYFRWVAQIQVYPFVT